MASVGNNQGDAAPPSPDNECVQMEGDNARAREEFAPRAEEKLKGKDSMSKQEADDWESALSNSAEGGMTVSSARSTVPSGSASAWMGSSSGVFNTEMPCCNATTTTPAQGVGTPSGATPAPDSGVLCDQSYFHKKFIGCGYHAEAKIFNSMSNAATGPLKGGQVKLKIDWKRRLSRKGKTGTGTSGMPCHNCYRMLCHAADVCKIEILICDSTNQPQPLGDCKEPGAYDKLKQRVNGVDKNGNALSNHTEIFH